MSLLLARRLPAALQRVRASIPLCRQLHTIISPLAAGAPVPAAPIAAAAVDPSQWRKYRKPISLQFITPHVARTVPSHIQRPPYAMPGFNEGQRLSTQRGGGSDSLLEAHAQLKCLLRALLLQILATRSIAWSASR